MMSMNDCEVCQLGGTTCDYCLHKPPATITPARLAALEKVAEAVDPIRHGFEMDGDDTGVAISYMEGRDWIALRTALAKLKEASK